jgi:hypothetical protein
LLGDDGELNGLPLVVQVVELVEDLLLQMRMVLDQVASVFVEQLTTWRALQYFLVKDLVRILFTVAGHRLTRAAYRLHLIQPTLQLIVLVKELFE